MNQGNPAMANATGGVCVNVNKGKPSHLSIRDALGRLGSVTKVDVVGEATSSHPISFDVTINDVQAKVIKIKLQGKGLPTITLRDPAGKIILDPPDPGTLTITLTDPTTATPPPVDPVTPVTYVDDPT
jgi:hypothetical protein